MTFDLAARGKTITNKFGDVNMWWRDQTWMKQAAAQPKDYFAANFPFVQRIEIMVATGGNQRLDLFKAPLDRTNLTDYDFGRLVQTCENIVAKGLKPMVKTGWVPLKLSAKPQIGEYGTNVRSPADYDAYYAYYAYIKAIAEALKEHFGIAELKTWSWGVGVEYQNTDWFQAEDGKPETTGLAFCRLYDTTVAALEDALGPENVTVGAHNMSTDDET